MFNFHVDHRCVGKKIFVVSARADTADYNACICGDTQIPEPPQ